MNDWPVDDAWSPPPHRPATWRERVAGWPESLTSQQAARHAIVIAAIALVVATAALVALVFAVSANALDQATGSPPPAENAPSGPVGPLLGPDAWLPPTPLELACVCTPTPELAAAVSYLHQQAVVAQQEGDRLWARWGITNRCEEGGDWSASGYAGNGLYVEGGLGMAAELYRGIAGHSALEDSPIAQMRIANIALARVGRGAWACPIGP